MIDKIREFYDNHLPRLTAKKQRHKWICKSLDRYIPKGIRVLDIGCGAGITSKHLAMGNRQVVAIDLSPKLIEYAKEHNAHDNIIYTTGDICSLTGDTFDAIVMADVLEHIQAERIPELFNVLSDISHEDTLIYLDIPHYDVLDFFQQNKPDALQIVDNPISVSSTLAYFNAINFVPAFFQFYWACYVEYLFISQSRRKAELSRTFG